MTKAVISTLLVLALSACRAGAQDRAEPEAVDAEAVLRLVEKLDDQDFEAREDATAALRKLGPAALPILEPLLEKASPECRGRIRGLAIGWGVLLKAERARLPEVLKRLRGRDETPRADAFDELLRMGPAGRAILEEELGGKGARLDLALAFDRRAVTVGQEVTGKGTLRNAGTAPYWRYAGSSEMNFYVGGAAPFGEYRPRGRIVRAGGVRGCGLMGWDPDYHPFRRWEAVLPGSPPSELAIRQPVQMHGVYEAVLRSSVSSGSLKRLLPGAVQPVELKVNASMDGEKALEVSRKEKLFVLPDFDAPGAGGEELALRVVPPQGPASAGRLLVATARLENTGAGASVWLEENLARYAWYAVLGEDGVPVRWGSWRSAAQGGEPEVLAARRVAPCEAAEWRLELPAGTLSPGTYRLAAGYEAAPYCHYSKELKENFYTMSFGTMRREEGEAVRLFERGRLCFRSEPFRVSGE